jgi:hypothetical protein
MQKNLVQSLVRWVFASVCLCAMFNNATAGAFTRGCAARDLQLLVLIEEIESTNTVSAETLSDVMLEMMHARVVCHEGYVVDALAIYDRISQSITISPVLFGQREGLSTLR